MTTHDPISRSRTSRPWRTVTALIVLASFVGSAACNDESFRPGPVEPSPAPAPMPAPPASSGPVYQTAPVEGVVREVGGGPLAGQTVTMRGVTNDVGQERAQTTTTDAAGRFRFDGYTSGNRHYPHITMSRPGYVQVNWPVPKGLQRPEPVSVNLSLQPTMVLTEDAPLHTTLSNDDTDYGWPDGPSWNLPVARGPVKVVGIATTSRGPHILRAEWSSADRLSLWAEVYYKEVHVEGSGSGSAVVELPADWTQDRLNPVTVTVGLQLTARASGGLSNPVNLTLTLSPKYPAP